MRGRRLESLSMFIDTNWGSLPKHGEELCGDNVEIVKSGDSVVAVIADGLGSGVKANILSKMTAKIIATMFEKGGRLDEIVDTVSHTLPVCQKRHIAYSTFTILEVKADGEVYVVEFDNPAVFYLHNGEIGAINYRESEICGKLIKESRFHVNLGDFLVAISDGVVHAGIGAILNLGWQWGDIAEYLQKIAKPRSDATSVCQDLLDACNQLYAGQPGDDATVLTIGIRKPKTLTVAVGPPQNRADDRLLVNLLREETGQKVICGGTTGTIIARALGREIEVDLKEFIDPEVPPTGSLQGIDLVTEGIITLSKALEYLKGARYLKDLPDPKNGAAALSRVFWENDRIRFLVGRAINPAHQNPSLPVLGLKTQVVNEIMDILKGVGKEVSVQYL